MAKTRANTKKTKKVKINVHFQDESIINSLKDIAKLAGTTVDTVVSVIVAKYCIEQKEAEKTNQDSTLYAEEWRMKKGELEKKKVNYDFGLGDK